MGGRMGNIRKSGKTDSNAVALPVQGDRSRSADAFRIAWAQGLEGAALLVLLVVLAVRGMVSEQVMFTVGRSGGMFADAGGPALMLGLHLLVGMAVVLCLASALVRGRLDVPVPGWLGGAALAFVVLLGVSVVFGADQKRAAMDGAIQQAGAVVILFLTAVLVRRPWQRRLVLCVVVAAAALFSYKCLSQYYVEFSDTIDNYEQTKEEYWAARGKTPDDAMVRAFEARLYSRDLGGFYFHGNLAGAFLMGVGLVCGGVAVEKWRSGRTFSRGWAVCTGVIAAAAVYALVLTASKEGIGGFVLGVLVAGVAWWRRAWLAKHFRAMMIVTGIVCVLGIVAVVGYGIAQDTLPSRSMQVRWDYWRASWDMLTDDWQGVTGVGANNYGIEYQRYKLARAEEEVTNPHNVLVHALCEYGAGGGVAWLVLVVGVAVVAVRQAVGGSGGVGVDNSMASTAEHMQYRTNGTCANGQEITTGGDSSARPVLWMLGILAGAGAIKLGVMWQPSVAAGIVAEMLIYSIVWCIAFCVASLNSDQWSRFETARLGRAWRVCVAGAIVGMLAGNMVGFSLFYPGTTMLYMVLGGLLLGWRGQGQLSERVWGRGQLTVAMVVAVSGVVLVYGGVYRPVCLVSDALYPFRPPDAVVTGVQPAPMTQADVHRLEAAIAVDGWNPAAPGMFGQLLAGQARDTRLPNDVQARLLDEAISAFGVARQRDGNNYHWPAKQAAAMVVLADSEADASQRYEYFARAHELMQDAVQLYPTGKHVWRDLARVEERIAEGQGDSDARASFVGYALKSYRRALALDDALPEESNRRFSQAEREQIERAIRQLGSG